METRRKLNQATERKKPLILKNAKDVLIIESAVTSVFGLTMDEIRNGVKLPKLVFARMILSQELYKTYTAYAITSYLNLKSHASVYNHLIHYIDDVKYNRPFREKVNAVKALIEESKTNK